MITWSCKVTWQTENIISLLQVRPGQPNLMMTYLDKLPPIKSHDLFIRGLARYVVHLTRWMLASGISALFDCSSGTKSVSNFFSNKKDIFYLSWGLFLYTLQTSYCRLAVLARDCNTRVSLRIFYETPVLLKCCPIS